jgi:hypothetical protein
MKPKTQIEIRRHPRFPETHDLVVVTTAQGRCYAATWANDPAITQERIRQTWKYARHSFQLYEKPLT